MDWPLAISEVSEPMEASQSMINCCMSILHFNIDDGLIMKPSSDGLFTFVANTPVVGWAGNNWAPM